jgi:hypothetical protein
MLVENRRTQAAYMPQSASHSSGIKHPYNSMADTAYLVRFKGADLPPEVVIAETIELHGEHIAFVRSDGSLAALFVLEIVESWSEVKR